MVGDDEIWAKVLAESELPPAIKMQAGMLIVACKWLQTEQINVAAETEHTIIARLKTGVQC
jgi:hypothetical protein